MQFSLSLGGTSGTSLDHVFFLEILGTVPGMCVHTRTLLRSPLNDPVRLSLTLLSCTEEKNK